MPIYLIKNSKIIQLYLIIEVLYFLIILNIFSYNNLLHIFNVFVHIILSFLFQFVNVLTFSSLKLFSSIDVHSFFVKDIRKINCLYYSNIYFEMKKYSDKCILNFMEKYYVFDCKMNKYRISIMAMKMKKQLFESSSEMYSKEQLMIQYQY